MTTHTGSSVTESERSITSAQLAYKLVNDASSDTKTYGCIQVTMTIHTLLVLL